MTTHQLILPQLNLCQFPCRLCYYRMEPKIHGAHHCGMTDTGNRSPEKIKTEATNYDKDIATQTIKSLFGRVLFVD